MRNVFAAVEDPISKIDIWLDLGRADSAQLIRQAMKKLPGSKPQLGTDVLRRDLLSVEARIPTRTQLGKAQSPPVSGSAVTQQRGARQQAVRAVVENLLADHPLALQLRERWSRCILFDQINPWMRVFVEPAVTEEDTEPWGTNRDLTRLVLAAALGWPVVVPDSEGRRWLFDRQMLAKPEADVDFSALLDHCADSLSPDASRVLDNSDFDTALTHFGVAIDSLAEFRSQLQNIATRTLETGDRVLILSRVDAKNIPNVHAAARRLLKITSSEATELIAAAHNRKIASIRNQIGTTHRS